MYLKKIHVMCFTINELTIQQTKYEIDVTKNNNFIRQFFKSSQKNK